MKRKTAANILDVDLHARRDEIDKNFRKKSRSCHPDRNGEEATEEMQKLSTAREVLRESADLCKQSMKIIEVRVNVKPNERFTGEVTFSGRCALCNGMGINLPDETEDCEFCSGRGIINPSKTETMQCLQCRGTGASFKREYLCHKCKGKKSEEITTTVKFVAPQSFLKGQVLFKKPFGGRNGIKEIQILAE